MYCEEKMIDGILHFRLSPIEDFKPYPIEILSEKVVSLKKKARLLDEIIKFISKE